MVPLGVTNMSRGDQGRMNLFCIFQYKSTRSHMQSKRNKMLTDLGKILPSPPPPSPTPKISFVRVLKNSHRLITNWGSVFRGRMNIGAE